MKHKKAVCILGILIAIFSTIATTLGIFTKGGPGPHEYISIRGESIEIYGIGLYKHMSGDVAIQGIAQDYVTLFVGVPLLLISLYLVKKGSLRGQFILSGTLAYFLLTYLFYLIMAMYNELFLVYAFLMGASFFALVITLLSFNISQLQDYFKDNTPNKLAGKFLIFNAVLIGLLWLSVVIPPLLDGSIYPTQLEHYTTLIVQGMDLGLMLPISFVSGVFLLRKKPVGFLIGPVFLIFLALLMVALTVKVIFMGIEGQSIIPPIFIMPTISLVAIILSTMFLKKLKS
ncbi:hypothetical protein [Haloplasma contractile]|uniref:Uncharacterized protein n=1 Tax=Haloplasma contractile SSD-17B TaxID=1033810 RepID=U2FEM5_9MOLU|nr:hypothetical protein [Haloplasma contractile]ERJ11400.1 hypothetical protein HLPCO_002522 [Haloplasma contractile SSD-17B]